MTEKIKPPDCPEWCQSHDVMSRNRCPKCEEAFRQHKRRFFDATSAKPETAVKAALREATVVAYHTGGRGQPHCGSVDDDPNLE